jgi:hypothetical protein
MGMLTTTIPRLARLARHAGPDTIVVRYEDLVREPVATRRALSDFLDLDLLEHSLASAEVVPASHRTSSDPESSIGRWRNELTAEQIDACEAAFAPYMRHFDYEPSGQTRRGAAGHGSDDGQIVAAEGALAVNAFVEHSVAEAEAGARWNQILELTFGRQGAGDAFTLEGWSLPERGFVWSCASESQVRLPGIQRPGGYVLHITAAPFTHGSDLPSQRVAVSLNGHQVGTARVRDICVLSIPVPAAVASSGSTITLTLRFPDAARPSALLGGDDHRTVGFSVHRIALFRIDMDGAAPGQVDLWPGRSDHSTGTNDGCRFGRCETAHDGMRGRVTELLRAAFGRPELVYYSRTALRKIPGFCASGFIRLILALEAEFGIELHEDEIDSIETLGDILVLLKNRNVGRPAATAVAPAIALTDC